MNKKLKEKIIALKNRAKIDNGFLKEFVHFLDSEISLTYDNNPYHHFCCFFVPVDVKNKKIFLGHHIKADMWIPPGGHIESGETPEETVRREFFEELSYRLNDEKVELFNLSVTHIGKSKRKCRTHYDLWYKVDVKNVSFVFDTKEFYKARWMDIKKAKSLITVDYVYSILSSIMQ